MRTREPRTISPNRYDNDLQRLNHWVRSGAYKRAYALAEQAKTFELERRLRALKGDTLTQRQPNRFPDQP
jgi:hypothetical protein